MPWIENERLSPGEKINIREENKSKGFKAGETGFPIWTVVTMPEVLPFWKTEIHTMFMSMPLVYVHACWKYSSSRCRRGLGIWWKRMNSFTRSICMWYLAVPEYSLWIIADTFPKMLAYISAGLDKKQSYGGRLHFGFILSSENLKYIDIFYYLNPVVRIYHWPTGKKNKLSQYCHKFYNFDDKSGEEKSPNSPWILN